MNRAELVILGVLVSFLAPAPSAFPQQTYQVPLTWIPGDTYCDGTPLSASERTNGEAVVHYQILPNTNWYVKARAPIMPVNGTGVVLTLARGSVKYRFTVSYAATGAALPLPWDQCANGGLGWMNTNVYEYTSLPLLRPQNPSALRALTRWLVGDQRKGTLAAINIREELAAQQPVPTGRRR